MRYVLHIGTNKTGTSALQDYLGANRDELLKHRIWYPRIGRSNNAHHDLAEAIKLGGTFADFGIDLDVLKETSAPGGVETVLISSENFNTLRDLSRVATLFPPDRTKVVVYLREHVSYLASWYQQDVQAARARITCSFDEYVRLQGYSFLDRLNLWREIYGGNLTVRGYSRNALRGGDIVQDFFESAFGCSPPVPPRPGDTNPSISGNLLFLKLVLNHVLTSEENRLIVEELSALAVLDKRFHGHFQISEQDANRIAHRFGPDRKKLKEEYGIVFVPPRNGVKGNVVPDMDLLKDDIAFLLNGAKLRGFGFYDIFLAKRAILFPAV
jgi:hypothetical protein